MLVIPLDTPVNAIMHSTDSSTGIDTHSNAPPSTNNHVQTKSKNTRINVPKNLYFHIPMYQQTSN